MHAPVHARVWVQAVCRVQTPASRDGDGESGLVSVRRRLTAVCRVPQTTPGSGCTSGSEVEAVSPQALCHQAGVQMGRPQAELSWRGGTRALARCPEFPPEVAFLLEDLAHPSRAVGTT